jgi:transposase
MGKPKTVGHATAVTAGCDCHLDSFTMVTVDGVGQPLEAARLVNDVAGWEGAVAVCRRWEVSVVGIEGASGYGRSLAQTLDRAGVGVLEVPTRLTARLRRIDGAGKTDPGDATAIARAVLRGLGSVLRDDPDLETVRVVSHRREELVRTQTQEINRLRALLAEVDPGRVQAMGRLRSLTQLQALAKVRYGGDRHRQTVAVLIRRIAADARDRLCQIRGLEKTLAVLLPPLGWTLISQTQGMGVVTAAGLLAELAGTDRFATDAKMAAWAGISPLDASSGRQHRHRLNRGGNRQANRAVHTIALTQLRHGGPAARYINQRTAQGKTQREALRAVKRHIIRHIWKIIRDNPPTPN